MIYEYKCAACEIVFEKILPMARYKEPLDEACPHCKAVGNITQFLGVMAPHIDSHKLGIKKPDAGFREVMAKIHEKSPKSQLKDFVNW